MISFPHLGEVGFYLYYLEAGLHVPPSSFFDSIIEAYKIRTFQLKPNLILNVICFELLCHATVVVPTVVLFQYFFLCVVMGPGIVLGLGDGVSDSIKNWKNEFIWLNVSCFPYWNEFHLPGMIDGQNPNMTSDLGQDIDKILVSM